MPVDQSIGATNSATPVRRRIRVKRRTATTRWLLLAVVAAGLSTSASAQQYRSDPVDDKALKNRGDCASVAGGTSNYATEKEKVSEFFNKYYFPSMTRFEPADLEKLGGLRFDLFRNYLWKTSNAELQRDLTDWALAAMQNIASKPVPSSRPLQRGARDRHARRAVRHRDGGESPAAQAAARGQQISGPDRQFSRRRQSGAAGRSSPARSIGLERHAQYHDGLPREAIEAMTAAALKIVTQDKPILDLDSQVYAWMRLKAASVLAHLGSVGTNNQIHDALVKMIADSKSLDDRLATAALLAKIKYDGAKVDGPAATEKMLKLARDVAEAEAKRAEEFRDKRFTGGGGGFVGGARRRLSGAI